MTHKYLTYAFSFILILCFTIKTDAQKIQNKNEIIISTIETNEGITSIQWATTYEVNSSYFIIEYSNDNKNFNIIKVLRASGSSMFPKNYEAEITASDSSIIFYRISLVMMDGVKKSSVIELPAGIKELDSEIISKY